jgi:hypothetical protein
MNRMIAGMIAGATTIIVAGSPSAAPPVVWSIDHFDVIQAEPFDPDAEGRVEHVAVNIAQIARMFGVDTNDVVDVEHPLTPALKSEIEDFLHEAAKRYQAWRFPEPRLTEVVTRADGKKAYRAYYTTIEDAAGLYKFFDPNNPLVPDYPALFLDADDIVGDNGIKPRG